MNSIKQIIIGLMALLLPAAASAQLVSFQPGTGRTEAKKAKKAKKEKGESFIPRTWFDDSDLEATVQADVVSRYIWRGQDLCGLSFQPSATVSWRGLSFNACGSTGVLKDDYQDIDLTLAYQFGPINIGITDYWATGLDTENRYFYYDPQKGGHMYEGNLGFTCKYFSLQGYCMFWGRDFLVDEPTKRAYSTYIELSVPFRLGNLDWQLTVGGTPMESGGEWETQSRETLLGLKDVDVRVYEYAEGPACCSATLRCTKNLDLGPVRMPLFAEINTNPYMSKAALLFGLSIMP